MKIKIGTQLDEELFRSLKINAAKEKRAISDIIQTAVTDYLRGQMLNRGQKSGLARFLESPPMNVSDKAFKKILEADYYDQ